MGVGIARRAGVGLLAPVVVAAVGLAPARPARAQAYQIQSLGTGFSPNKINMGREVVGSTTASTSHAAIWLNGTVADLGALAAGRSSLGSDINDAGVVGGVGANASSQNVAFRWVPSTPNGLSGTMTAVSGATATVFGINSSGDIAGRLFNSALGASYPIIWLGSGGTFRPLGNPSTGDIAGGQDVNDRGDVVGFYSPTQTANSFGFFYNNTSGQLTNLRLSGDDRGLARRVNERGQVVGESTSTAGAVRGFVWQSGSGTTALPVPAGSTGTKTSAFDLNDSGAIVGYGEVAPGTNHAVLWLKNDAGAYVATDLNALLPTGSGWVLTGATGINASGDIVGSGTLNGVAQGFLLVNNVVWGARVRLSLSDGTSRPDYLVAFRGGKAILKSGVVLPTSGLVQSFGALGLGTGGGGTTIQSITVLSNDPAGDANGDGRPDDGGPAQKGYNRFVATDTVDTDGGAQSKYVFELAPAGGTAFSAATGNWSYLYYRFFSSSGQFQQIPGTGPLAEAYAIPRAPDPTPAGGNYYTSLLGAVRTTAADTSFVPGRVFVPRQILYAIAWQENQWEDFGYVTAYTGGGSSGVTRVSDPAGDRRTVVTVDGGIGLFQFTGLTTFSVLPPLAEYASADPRTVNLTHLSRLSGDLNYTVETAGNLMSLNWNSLSGAMSPEFLENWFQPATTVSAVQKYNRYLTGYAAACLEHIRNGDYQDKVPVANAGDPDVAEVPLSDPGRFPAHGDLDWNGSVETTVSEPVLRKLAAPAGQNSLSVSITSSLPLTQVSAVVYLKTGPVSVSLTNSTGSTYTGTFAGSTSIGLRYPVSVRLSSQGTRPDGAPITGAAYGQTTVQP